MQPAFVTPLSCDVTWLEIRGDPGAKSRNHIASAKWRELFHSFTAVQSLRVDTTLVPFVVPVLQELTGEWATDVLPALRNLSFGGFASPVALQDSLMSFVAARQLLGQPVTVGRWEEGC
jgi:hypothetical protein